MTPLARSRLRFALYVVGPAIIGLISLVSMFASCRRVEDGRDAACLGVAATHGLCLEWRARP